MSAALHPKGGRKPSTTLEPKPTLRRSGAPDSRKVQPCTIAQVCAAAGISRRMFFMATKVQREACPELWQMVRDGRVTMNLAATLADMFPHADDQRAVIAEFSDLPSRQRLGFARQVAALMTRGSSPAEPGANPAQTDSEPAGFTNQVRNNHVDSNL